MLDIKKLSAVSLCDLLPEDEACEYGELTQFTFGDTNHTLIAAEAFLGECKDFGLGIWQDGDEANGLNYQIVELRKIAEQAKKRGEHIFVDIEG